MKLFRFLAAVSCISGMQVAQSYAADIRTVQIVAGEDNSFVRNAASSLAKILKQADPALNVEIAAATGKDLKEVEPDKRMLVLIGESAVTNADAGIASGSVVLAMLPQRPSLEMMEKKQTVLSVIYFEQPLTRLLNLAELINSGVHSTHPTVLGVVATAGLQGYLTGAEAAADERKQILHIEMVNSELAVGRAVARVVENSSILLAIPDPLVQTANTVQSILLLTYRAGVPVIGYSTAYLRAGAAVVLYSTPEQLAQQAAETIAAYRSGKSPPAIQKPRYFTVGVNSTVLHSLGIELPDTDFLEKKLRLMKE